MTAPSPRNRSAVSRVARATRMGPVMTGAGERGEPELTMRALFSGTAIGGVLAAANVFMGLKTGWNDSGNITACIVGFAIMTAWARRRRIAATELNTVQSIAT